MPIRLKVFALDLDNMRDYSSNDHYAFHECFASRKAARDFLEGNGFKPVHDKWAGETVFRWTPEMDEYGSCKPSWECERPLGVPEWWDDVQATIIPMEVVS